jgi:hypothetical protein
LLCFDVLEHIMSLKAILLEWQRVLTRNGKVFIWWQPYFHPYGHHLMAYMPIPWAHVIFSSRTIGIACKRIFDLPEYVPRYWDLNEKGEKKNKVFSGTKDMGGVNGVTISRFERLCKATGLRIRRAQAYPFVGSRLVTYTSMICSRVPFVREFFTAYMIYELEKV